MVWFDNENPDDAPLLPTFGGRIGASPPGTPPPPGGPAPPSGWGRPLLPPKVVPPEDRVGGRFGVGPGVESVEGGAPPQAPQLPEVSVGVNLQRTDFADPVAFNQLDREAAKWLHGVPWGFMRDEQIERLVKTTVEAMAIQRGLRITWD